MNAMLHSCSAVTSTNVLGLVSEKVFAMYGSCETQCLAMESGQICNWARFEEVKADRSEPDIHNSGVAAPQRLTLWSNQVPLLNNH